MIVAREQVEHNYGIPREERRKRLYPRRRSQISRRSRMVFTGLVALAFITGIIISFYYAQVFVTNYRIHNLQKQLAILQEETDDLQVNLAKLTSLERIERIAINDLGMVKPDSSKVVKVAVNIDLEKQAALGENQENEKFGSEQKVHPTGQEQKHNWVIQSLSDLLEKVKEVPAR